MSKQYTLASERADAPTGCAYVATDVLEQVVPLGWKPGIRLLPAGRAGQGRNHTGLQIFPDGEWHPVVGWTLDNCGPATDYQEVQEHEA